VVCCGRDQRIQRSFRIQISDFYREIAPALSLVIKINVVCRRFDYRCFIAIRRPPCCVIMHEATAVDSGDRDETSEDIKDTKESRTGVVSSIMDKYTLADPWPAKHEKVALDYLRCSETQLTW